jgi:hypothetical protein
MNAFEWGVAHGSCKEALKFRKALGSDKTQADWWKVCRRGDWLIRQLRHGLTTEEFTDVMPALLKAVEKIVTRVVQTHVLKCGISIVEEWAVKWLNGEDRTAVSARMITTKMGVMTDIATVLTVAAVAWMVEWMAVTESVWVTREVKAAVWAIETIIRAAVRTAEIKAGWAAEAADAEIAVAAKAGWEGTAADIAWAAEETEITAWAEVTTEHKQQADDIRSEIPEWIWS